MSSRRQKRSSNRPALLKTKKATKQALLDELPNIDISLEKTIETLATSSLSSTSNNLKRPFKSSVLLKKKQKTVPQETPTSSSPKPTNASSEKQPVSNELNEDFDRVQLRFNFNNVMYSTNKNSDYFICISPSNNFLYKKFPFEYDKWPKTRQPQTVLNTFLEKLTNENEETLEKKKERLNNFPSWIKLFSTELFNQLSSLYPYEVPENTCLKIGVHFQDEWPELQTLLEEYHQVFGNSKDLGKVRDEDLSIIIAKKIKNLFKKRGLYLKKLGVWPWPSHPEKTVIPKEFSLENSSSVCNFDYKNHFPLLTNGQAKTLMKIQSQNN